jgi:hypothetical protein
MGASNSERQERIRSLMSEFSIAAAHYRWVVAELKRQYPNLTSAERLIFCELIEEARDECQRLWCEFAALLDLRPKISN